MFNSEGAVHEASTFHPAQLRIRRPACPFLPAFIDMELLRRPTPVFIALLLSNVAPVLAQLQEVYYDPSMITGAVPENVCNSLAMLDPWFPILTSSVLIQCRGHCTPISQTFEACADTECLCTRENNQVLLRCVNCLYFDEPRAQTYEVAQQTLKGAHHRP